MSLRLSPLFRKGRIRTPFRPLETYVARRRMRQSLEAFTSDKPLPLAIVFSRSIWFRHDVLFAFCQQVTGRKCPEEFRELTPDFWIQGLMTEDGGAPPRTESITNVSGLDSSKHRETNYSDFEEFSGDCGSAKGKKITQAERDNAEMELSKEYGEDPLELHKQIWDQRVFFSGSGTHRLGVIYRYCRENHTDWRFLAKTTLHGINRERLDGLLERYTIWLAEATVARAIAEKANTSDPPSFIFTYPLPSLVPNNSGTVTVVVVPKLHMCSNDVVACLERNGCQNFADTLRAGCFPTN